MDNQQINIETTGIRVYSEITDLDDADTGQTGTRATTIIYLKGNPVK
jgi:hypothetical protein